MHFLANIERCAKFLEYTLHALIYSNKTAFLKQKNALHFISITVLVLEIFKFKNFRILNLKRSSNAYAWNKESILLNNLGGKHSLVMKFVQFVWYYKKKKLSSKYSTKMLDFKRQSSTYLYLISFIDLICNFSTSAALSFLKLVLEG